MSEDQLVLDSPPPLPAPVTPPPAPVETAVEHPFEFRGDAREYFRIWIVNAALTLLTQGRHGIAWGAIGAAQACFAEVLGYTSSRVLFGRPLAHTQSIQTRLADMARRITTAQLLALRLGRLNEAKAMRPAHASLAKWNNVRMALDVARDCRDMLGAAGITAEHVAIRHMLNLESVVTYEGTEIVHALVVGKELTGVGAF